MTAAATGRHSNYETLTATGTAAETTDTRAAPIVMTETGTQDPTETEALEETGTAEARPLALHCTVHCTALHGDTHSEHSPSPMQFLVALLAGQSLLQCKTSLWSAEPSTCTYHDT